MLSASERCSMSWPLTQTHPAEAPRPLLRHHRVLLALLTSILPPLPPHQLPPRLGPRHPSQSSFHLLPSHPRLRAPPLPHLRVSTSSLHLLRPVCHLRAVLMVFCRSGVPRTAERLRIALTAASQLPVGTKQRRGGLADDVEVFPCDKEMIGCLIGRAGLRVKELASLSGCSQIRYDAVAGTMNAKGSAAQCVPCTPLLETLYEICMASSALDDIIFMPCRRQEAYRIMQLWMAAVQEETVPMPVEMHGVVIGLRGKNVQEIEAESGAKVRFDRNGTDASMLVTGSKEQREIAIAMAKEQVAKHFVEEEDVELGPVDTATARALIGTKGSNVKAIEEGSGARIRFQLDGGREGSNSMTLRGTQTQRDAARNMVEVRLKDLGAETRHSLEGIDIRTLVGRGGSVVKRLEAESGASISVVQAEPSFVSIRGEDAQREAAWKCIQAVIEASEETIHEIPLPMRRVIIGTNGTNVKALEEETGARVTMFWDDEKAKARINGNAEQRNAAWAKIEQWIESPDFLTIEQISPDAVTDFLRYRAKRLRDVEVRSSTSISIARDPESGEAIVGPDGCVEVNIRGVGESRSDAAAMLQQAGQQLSETYVLAEVLGVAECTILDVRRLIGRKGATVAAMEKASGASISFDPSVPPKMQVTGTAEAKARVLELVRADHDGREEDIMPLAVELHGTLIGVGGRTIKRLERDSGAQISFRSLPEPGMVVRGTADQRKSALSIASKLLESDVAEAVYIEKRNFGFLIGKEGRVIRDFERESGARVQVLTDSNRDEVIKLGLDVDALIADIPAGLDQAVVVIKGTEEQRKLAKELVLGAIEQEGSAQVGVTAEQREYLQSSNSLCLRELEQAHSVQFRFVRAPASQGIEAEAGQQGEVESFVECRGRTNNRAAAIDALRAVLDEKEESHEMAHAEFPLLSVRLVIGTKGQRVKQIEAQSGARVRFDTSEPVRAIIRGSDEARAKAWELLQAVESESQIERFPLKMSKHYLLIGRGGEVVKTIEGGSQTAICFATEPEPAMIVMGEATGRAKAWELANQILEEIGEVEQEIFEVGREHHAVLIGSNGRQIQKIEKESGARVQFQADKDMCMITGSAEQRRAAWDAISLLIEQGFVERFPIDATQVRLLIGPGGSIVREIEARSGTHISMEREPEPGMVVRGTAEGRAEAIRMAREILAGDAEEAFYVEQRYHGYLIGTGGERVRSIEAETGTRIQMSATEPVLSIRGSPERRDAAWERIQVEMDKYDDEVMILDASEESGEATE